MSCVIPLSHLSTQVGTVTWSQDQRIAVTTSEAICIETLLGVCHAHSSKTHPSFTISTALAPARHALPHLIGCTATTTAVTDYFPKPGTMTRFLDPVLGCGEGNQSRDLFVASDWSPAGCNHLGGCLLSCLTFSGRLLLLSPPGSTSTHWRTIADMTHLYSTLLAAHLLQQQQQRVEEKVDVENPESTAICEEPSPKRPKYDFAEGADHIGKRMALACSAHAWLPAVLPTSGGGRNEHAVVAMATRSGHVILWSLRVPLPARSVEEKVPLSLLRTLQLPLPAETWACSLKWHHRTTASAVHLTVGSTNGMVLDFRWSELTINAGGEVSQPSLATLWPCMDGIPVHHIAWQTKSPARGRGWVVIDKGSSLVALDTAEEVTAGVGTSESPPPPHLLVCGLHNMPVSGLCALSDGTFISSSLDSTVQRFTLPTTPTSRGKSRASHVTPEPIAIASLSPGQPYTTQGIAVSQSGLFIAAAVNPQCDFSYKKKRYRSELHLNAIAGGSEVERSLKHAVVCEWDICEHLRQEFVQTMELPVYVQKLVARWSEDLPLPQLQFQLQMCHISRKAGKDEKCAALIHTILRRHVVSALQSWQRWTEEGAVTDSQSAMSLQLMGQWLLSTGNTSRQLAQEVVARLPAESRHPEMCPLCGASMVFTDPREEVCSSGHKWKRCSITLCLATDPQCRRCVQCGAQANTIQSLAAQPGTWLHHLLCAHPHCILCKGHFEQVV